MFTKISAQRSGTYSGDDQICDFICGAGSLNMIGTKVEMYEKAKKKYCQM